MSQWQNNSNACLWLYQSNSSMQQPESRVNNGSMCPPWTWTTAFNRGRHWSTALLMSCWSRLAKQVHSLSLRSSKSTHRTAEYSCQLFNSTGTSAGSRVVFLTAYQLSYMLDMLFRCDSPRLSATKGWEIEFVVSILHRSLTELTVHFLLEYLYKYVLHVIPFLNVVVVVLIA